MKISGKKVFCVDCHRLVPIKESTTNGTQVILCPRCGKTLRTRTGMVWR